MIGTFSNALPVSEEAKLELREEVDFLILRMHAATRHVKHSLHMYTRDAVRCVKEGEETVARQLIAQKLLAERRADNIAIHVSLLESVRTSLEPESSRCRGDMLTCRAILDRCAVACMQPEVLSFMDVPSGDDADHATIDVATDDVGVQAVEEELTRLVGAVMQPSGAEAPLVGQAGAGGALQHAGGTPPPPELCDSLAVGDGHAPLVAPLASVPNGGSNEVADALLVTVHDPLGHQLVSSSSISLMDDPIDAEIGPLPLVQPQPLLTRRLAQQPGHGDADGMDDTPTQAHTETCGAHTLDSNDVFGYHACAGDAAAMQPSLQPNCGHLTGVARQLSFKEL